LLKFSRKPSTPARFSAEPLAAAFLSLRCTLQENMMMAISMDDIEARARVLGVDLSAVDLDSIALPAGENFSILRYVPCCPSSISLQIPISKTVARSCSCVVAVRLFWFNICFS
jgi:hypothetical protein